MTMATEKQIQDAISAVKVLFDDNDLSARARKIVWQLDDMYAETVTKIADEIASRHQK